MGDDWPFEEPRNLAVITTKRIVREGWPILLVSHDEDDGGWQFLDGEPAEVEEALVVGLAEVVAQDPSLRALSDLPLGWQAWRAAPDQPWRRRPA